MAYHRSLRSGWVSHCLAKLGLNTTLLPGTCRQAHTAAPTTGVTNTPPALPATLGPCIPSNLPPPKDFKVATAKFVKSSSSMQHMPHPVGPEFAFIGHSNVGKSSLINMLTGQKDLAKVSKRPGKTTCINHFLINKKYYLVDCPGYGYAQVSKTERLQWHGLTQQFFTQRSTLAHVFLLVDATQLPNKMDVDCALWLHNEKVPFSLVYTKLDCPSADGIPPPAHNIPTFNAAVASLMYSAPPPYIPTSAVQGQGRDELLKYISQLRQTFKMPLIFR